MVLALAADASAVVTDFGFLRRQRTWRANLADESSVPCVAVEGEVVVPTALVSDSREYAARTIRPKLHKHVDRFLAPQRTETV